MDIVLMGGLWLQSDAWDEVAAELRKLGDNPIPVALPGTDDHSITATLEDQIEAAIAAVDSAGRPVVVGHSAACTLAWLVADRRPDTIHSVVMIGGFPSSDGEAYADFFDVADGVMAFPGWDKFEGPDSDDIPQDMRNLIEARAVPVPEGVARATVRLHNAARYDVPVVVVCPEFSPDDAREWMEGGHLPELVRTANLEFVDIDSGHWPMYTRPAELARILHEIGAGR